MFVPGKDVNDRRTSAPKISVVCAVYKAEQYLRRCVDSILNQTFGDFELLLVEDGSPDGSGAICDEYARKDSRVRVYHKPNEGVSATRQFAIDHARGEYTIHVDPDDWVDSDMLETLYAKAVTENADMVICCYFWEGRGIVEDCPTALDVATVRQDLLMQRIGGSCCNKLIRRDCYSRHGVKFPVGINYMEDYLVCLKHVQHDIKIAYVDKAFYHYDRTSNDGSLTRVYTLSTFDTRCRVLAEVKQILGDTKDYYVQVGYVAYEGFVKEVLTDRDFVRRFGRAKWKLLRHGKGMKLKAFTFLSACGLQGLARGLHHMLKRTLAKGV